MDILRPPDIYKKYRCAVHSLTGQELALAQERFYKKEPESRTEICRYFNWLEDQRSNGNLPFERVEIRDSDGKKHGHVSRVMISDIEYWIEGGEMKQKKIYMANQGELAIKTEKQVEYRPSVQIEFPREPGMEG